MREQTTLVTLPRRVDGVGNALRAAFRDQCRDQVPADMQALLQKLN